MEIVDVYGKTIRTIAGTNNDSPMQTRVNVRDLAPGLYFIHLTTNQGVVTKTFVKK